MFNSAKPLGLQFSILGLLKETSTGWQVYCFKKKTLGDGLVVKPFAMQT